MKITKARLVKIIKEELGKAEALEELFKRSKREYSGGYKGAGERGPEEDTSDERIADDISKLKRTSHPKQIASVAASDAINNAKKMDQKTFERVMKWANEQGLATDQELADISQKTFERVMQWANDNNIQAGADAERTLEKVSKLAKELKFDDKINSQFRDSVLDQKELVADIKKRLGTYYTTKSDLQNALRSNDMIDQIAAKVAKKINSSNPPAAANQKKPASRTLNLKDLKPDALDTLKRAAVNDEELAALLKNN